MIRLLSFGLIFLLSCKEQLKENSYNQNEAFEKSKNSKNLGDTIIVSAKYPSIIKEVSGLKGDIKINQKWNSLAEIQKEWIKVEKDNKGYLIYEPCDGRIPTIKFLKNSEIEIDYGIDEPITYGYDKFTRFIGNSSFMLGIFNNNKKQPQEFTCKIIDSKNGIVLWEFDGFKWMMTPKQNDKYFRKIINECYEKTGELEFETIK